ncbi:aprataxin and PNK-like factor [Mustelus asterias]
MMELEPEDGSGTITLASGLTAIGRGPVLRVSDKRVSRNHGLLEVIDGKLRIKPLHINPCFHRSSSGDQLLPLEKDKWHWLNPGDSFSLLPDKYIYKVISPSFDQTLRNSDLSSFEDDIDEPNNCQGNLHVGKGDVSEDADISQGYTEKPTTSSGALTTDDRSRQQSSTIEPKSILEKTSKNELLKSSHASLNSVQRKRILPAWMLQVTTEIQNPSPTVSKKGNARGRGRGRSDAEQTKTQVTQPGKKRHEDFETVKENNAEQPQEKKGRRRKTDEDEEQNKDNTNGNIPGASSSERKEEIKNNLNTASKANENWRLGDSGETKKQRYPNPQQSPEVGDWVMSDKEEEEDDEVVEMMNRRGKQEGAQQSETSHAHGQGTLNKARSPQPDEPEPGEDASALQTTRQKKPRRAPCMYGRNCYRKNPQHFQELSHPGDADYEDSTGEEEEEEDGRPECPFGTACYRKNPQHKKEYKHTQPPESELRRPKRKVAQKGKSGLDGESDTDGEPNQYDLNDSFIDDEEDELEPTDEDSDWEPSAESNEDIETLAKEANRFVKNKK